MTLITLILSDLERIWIAAAAVSVLYGKGALSGTLGYELQVHQRKSGDLRHQRQGFAYCLMRGFASE